MWNNERVLGVVLLVLAVPVALSVSTLRLWEEFTLGPGATPAIYLAGTIICAAGLVLRPAPESRGSFAEMFGMPGRQGLLMFVLTGLMAGAVYIVGFPAAIFCFSVAVLILIQGWRIVPAILFSAIWAMALQLVFGWLLDIRFVEGFLFG